MSYPRCQFILKTGVRCSLSIYHRSVTYCFQHYVLSNRVDQSVIDQSVIASLTSDYVENKSHRDALKIKKLLII